MFKNIFLCSKIYIYVQQNIYSCSKIYIQFQSQKYIFIFKKNIYLCSKIFIYICSKIYIYVPKISLSSLLRQAHPALLYQRGGGGEPKKVALFQRHRPEEFLPLESVPQLKFFPFSPESQRSPLTARCWQAIADSHTPASGRNKVFSLSLLSYYKYTSLHSLLCQGYKAINATANGKPTQI